MLTDAPAPFFVGGAVYPTYSTDYSQRLVLARPLASSVTYQFCYPHHSPIISSRSASYSRRVASSSTSTHPSSSAHQGSISVSLASTVPSSITSFALAKTGASATLAFYFAYRQRRLRNRAPRTHCALGPHRYPGLSEIRVIR